MPSIKLGNRPKSFDYVVKFKDLDGTELAVPVSYKYRTRKEYGAWSDAFAKYPDTKDAIGEDGQFKAEAYIEQVSEWSANKLMQCLDGWKLDEEFNAANVKQLCDEMPACAEAIIDGYKNAILSGHLGN
jgi:hypothetical protein